MKSLQFLVKCSVFIASVCPAVLTQAVAVFDFEVPVSFVGTKILFEIPPKGRCLLSNLELPLQSLASLCSSLGIGNLISTYLKADDLRVSTCSECPCYKIVDGKRFPLPNQRLIVQDGELVFKRHDGSIEKLSYVLKGCLFYYIKNYFKDKYSLEEVCGWHPIIRYCLRLKEDGVTLSMIYIFNELYSRLSERCEIRGLDERAMIVCNDVKEQENYQFLIFQPSENYSRMRIVYVVMNIEDVYRFQRVF